MGTSLLPEELMNFSWRHFKMAMQLSLSFRCCLWIYRGIEHCMGKDSARSLPLLFYLRRAQFYPLRLCHPSSTIPGDWESLPGNLISVLHCLACSETLFNIYSTSPSVTRKALIFCCIQCEHGKQITPFLFVAANIYVWRLLPSPSTVFSSFSRTT